MFRRQIEILGEKQEILKQKSVLVIGAGGLGNIVMSEIGCIGLKEIYLIDFDEIEIHNIHRQFQFTQRDIGKYKSKVLADRTHRCGTKIFPIVEKFETFDKRVDLIIDCSDNFEVRKKIDTFAKKIGVPWIYGSVESWVGQICLFKNRSFDIFNLNDSSHKVMGVMPSMVGIIGSIQAGIATKYLAEIDVEVDKLYYIDFGKELKISGFRV